MTGDLERLRITIATLEQLLAVHEEVAARQSRRLEAAHGEAMARARELEESRAALAASELRKSAMVEASLDAIITIDEDGIVTEFSSSAEQIFGFARQEAVGHELAELIIPEELRDRHRAGLAHYLATGEGPVLNQRIELEAIRKDGARFPVEITIVPVVNDDERFFTGFVRDITQQKRAAERIQHLQRVTDTVLTSLSLSELLPELLNRLEEVLTPDTIAIMLVDDDGTLELRAGRGLATAEEDYRLPMGVGIAGRVAVERTAVIADDIAELEDVHEVLRASAIVSMLAVPLMSAGTLLGVLHIGSRTPRRFTDEDADLLQRIADRIAIAIEHARWFEREQNIAHTLQMSLLPEQIPPVPGVDVSVRYLPAGDGTKVGGDWYDVIALADGRVGFAMGDVVGRGIKAASVMGQLRHALRAFAFDGAPPDEVLASLDRMISRSESPEMATVLYAIFDPRTATVSYASAGHPPPLLAATNGSTRYLEDGASIPIGIMGDASYTCATLELPPGSMLVLYTDGLVERRGEDLAEGMERLAAAVNPADRSAIDAGEDILTAMFPEGEPKDDVAFMVIRYDPAGPDGLHVQLPAEPGRLASFRADLERWLRQLDLPESAVFELVVAANEAAANAVEHAYGPGDASFEVEASVSGDLLTIRVRDKGRWRLPRPSRGGRGIHMMEAFADEVLLRPRADGTEVVIRRSLTELKR